MLLLIKSIDNFSNNSRAFWYMHIPLNTYVNVNALKSFCEYLGTKFDPMKEEIIFRASFTTNEGKVDHAYLFSRAATILAINEGKDLLKLSKMINEKAVPFTKSIYNYELSEDAQKMMDLSSFDKIKSCDNEKDVELLSESLLFFYNIEKNPEQCLKMELLKKSENNYYVFVNNNRTDFCYK